MTSLAPTVQVPLSGGRLLDATVRGSGGPTVVFEAGMGAGQHSWALVAPAVAERTRVVTYDRCGIGRSSVDPEARTVSRAASDLVALLADLDAGPAVLVGHSYGGIIVREVLAVSPALVAGLVLVDQTDEGCDLFFATSAERQGRVFAAALPVLAGIGVTRLIARQVAKPLPPDARRAVAVASGSLAGARAHQRELAACDTDMRRLRDHPHPLADVPVTLISGTRRPRGGAASRRRSCLVAAHERRASALPQGRHVRAANSEHFIMFSEPVVVIEEVVRLVDALGTSR